MCRFTFYLGPKIPISSLLTEPSHSLIRQSFCARERDEPLNGDGFGVAYYVPQRSDEPAIFRSISPAWSNSNLRHLARVTDSPCILAHVRAATQGLPVTETNCHPFSWKQFALVHNGDVGGFRTIRRHLLNDLSDDVFQAIQGSTDSEHLFALFVEMHTRTDAGLPPHERMAQALEAAVARVVEHAWNCGVDAHSYLNVAVTDGARGVVMRFTTDEPAHADSLYLNTGRRYVCRDGACHMLDPDAGQEAVVVSSEPLSTDPGWQTIPVNHLVIIDDRRQAIVRPMRVP